MWSDLWMRSCVGLWSTMAQAGVPAPAAPAASPAAPAAPAASGAPVTVPLPAGSPGVEGAVAGMTTEPFTTGPSLAWSLMHGSALVLYFVICVALVVCVMFQTTKAEGLSGVIGGTSSSAMFKGKKSAEEALTQWTGRLAVAFIVMSFLVWRMFSRMGG